jgi:hypothetical protein
MATVYPNANDKYETVANWYDDATGAAYGSLPLAGDLICLNNKAVTVDATTLATLTATPSLLGITNVATGARAAGGMLTISTGGFTLNVNYSGATGIVAGTGTYVVAINHTTDTVVVNGDSYASATTACKGIGWGTSGTIEINGNISGGGFVNAWGAYLYGSGICTVTGRLIGGTVASCFGTVFGGTATHNIIGDQWSPLGSVASCIVPFGGPTLNIYGDLLTMDGAGGSGNVIGIYSTANGTVNHYGDMYFGTNPSSNTIWEFSTQTYNANTVGNITGGPYATKSCINSNNATNTNTITTTGDIIGGSGNNAIQIYNTNIDVTGTITAGTYAAISKWTTALTGEVIARGNVVNVDGVNAIYSRRLQLDETAVQTWIVQDTSNVDRTLYTNPSGFPVAGDVRDGTTFGEASEFEGTLAIPTPAQVLVDVPTDDTVGTFTGGGSINYSAIADIVGVIVENNFP